MLEVLDNIEELDISVLAEHEKRILETYKKAKSIGGKVIFKKKITKSGTFLNIYVYDKTCWKYLLRFSFKIG